jgi:deazaflavin-dependent oxidoreductase (nitroreductase family)
MIESYQAAWHNAAVEVDPMGSLITRSAKYFNPLVLGLAGSGLIPVWAVIVHTGRRSGRRYRTPIAIYPNGNEFVIPLPFGKTDWCRNVMAASDTVIRWKGRDYHVGSAHLVDEATGTQAFPPMLRRPIALLGIKQFLAVQRVDAAAEAA